MKLWRLIAVNLAVLLALAVVGELVFGQWIAASPLGRLAVPRNVKVTISAAPLYPGGREFLYRRDAMGFRGSGIDPARISILTIGGSTTNQLYLPDEATWQAALERSLRQTGHDGVVANAGVDGQSTVGMIADLELWFPNVPHLKPHLVLASRHQRRLHQRPGSRSRGRPASAEAAGQPSIFQVQQGTRAEERPGRAVDHRRRLDSGQPSPIAPSSRGFCPGPMDGSARPTRMAG